MKDSVEDMMKASDKANELLEKYGSIEDIPLAEKEKLIKKARKNMDLLNGMHIIDMRNEIEKMKTHIILLDIALMALGLALLLRFIIK
jgi:hypothetical protein